MNRKRLRKISLYLDYLTFLLSREVGKESKRPDKKRKAKGKRR